MNRQTYPRKGATKDSMCDNAYCHIHGILDAAIDACTIRLHEPKTCKICDKERKL